MSGITLHVLIIDDNKMDRELAREALSDMTLEDIERFEVEEAAFGRDGVKKALQGHYHVILLDYNLPDITGLDVLREIKASNIGTPVIAMTSAGGEQTARQFLAAGARDYVTKDQLTDVRLAITIRNVVWMAKLGSRLSSSTFKEGWKSTTGAAAPSKPPPPPAGNVPVKTPPPAKPASQPFQPFRQPEKK